jgi:hypothetical protein
MPVTFGIQTRESPDDVEVNPLHCTTRIVTKILQTTDMHCLKTNCLESDILLEFVIAGTILEQAIKGPVAITQWTLSKTQDTSDKKTADIFSF